jgi:hypothetical protein
MLPVSRVGNHTSSCGVLCSYISSNGLNDAKSRWRPVNMNGMVVGWEICVNEQVFTRAPHEILKVDSARGAHRGTRSPARPTSFALIRRHCACTPHRIRAVCNPPTNHPTRRPRVSPNAGPWQNVLCTRGVTTFVPQTIVVPILKSMYA